MLNSDIKQVLVKPLSLEGRGVGERVSAV